MHRIRRLWPEPVAVLVAATVLFAGHAWLARFGLDLVDEGYFLDLASRVQHGQLPYRDFDTYYTPGVFYLNAAVLSLFGSNVVPTRLLMVGVRVACALLAYVLARRLAPPAFAAVPALVIATMATLVGPHPGWPALLATLLMIEALARADATESRTWLAATGGFAALAFLFKQNVGAFAAIAAVGYMVLRPRVSSSAVQLVLRLVYVLGLAVVVRVFLGSALDPLLSSVLWLPLVGTLVVLLAWCSPSWTTGGAWAGMAGLNRDIAAFGCGALAVSAAWLVPLVAALGPGETPFALFVGSVNQGALTFELEAPPRGAVPLGLLALWAPLAIAVAWRARAARLVPPFVVAALATPLILWLPTREALADPLALEPIRFPRLAALDVELGSLFVYLPALVAWSSLLLLAVRRGARARPPREAWFLLVGTLAALALFPRADNAHAVLAGAPLLVVGAAVLARVHARLAPGLAWPGRSAVFLAVLVIPTAAVVPHLYGRYLAFVHAEPESPGVYAWSGLERASVWLPARQAAPLSETVEYVQRNTAPGESVFAYPMDPLLNFLADRPNPTRFDHFLPGALSAGDMQAVVQDLEAARPRFVVWDHGAVTFWQTDLPNRTLSDYIWRCYRQVAAFRLFLVLERSDC
jgi:hypothetical protein